MGRDPKKWLLPRLVTQPKNPGQRGQTSVATKMCQTKWKGSKSECDTEMNPRTSHVLYPTKHIGPHHTNNCSAWTHKQMKELQHNLTTKYGIGPWRMGRFIIIKPIGGLSDWPMDNGSRLARRIGFLQFHQVGAISAPELFTGKQGFLLILIGLTCLHEWTVSNKLQIRRKHAYKFLYMLPKSNSIAKCILREEEYHVEEEMLMRKFYEIMTTHGLLKKVCSSWSLYTNLRMA
ncbi:hypothetical protein FH972_004117 [Carpinus fangiana]|uniref:Uncharacterized protein n=1 Tax=Carpinus fangiana TaxID=176857 RepID=A0A5N6QK42_9ROSI|nr:hypothetical protein FH972_004117 [Carpinus fangiana]